MRLVDLGGQAGRPVGRLSGGQQARASLAAVLLGAPELLVLDEPTVGQDPLLREQLWRQFRRLADDGATLLVSSHVMDEAARCDQLVLLRDGRVLTAAPPEELRARTGEQDMEQVFLALIRTDRKAAGMTMAAAATVATSRRVLTQLLRDRRSTTMIIIVPALLLVLVRSVLAGRPGSFQRVGLPLVGIFPLALMFLLTSVAMLRERTSGALERLMTMPIAKTDVLFGYAGAFALLGILQSTIVAAVAIGLLGLHVEGDVVVVLAFVAANALLGLSLGLSLGLLVSAVAATELQAEQSTAALLLPQLTLCGIFAPRDTMPQALEWISDGLPMTYAYDGLTRLTVSPAVTGRLLLDLAVVLGSAGLALTLGAATLRRRTP